MAASDYRERLYDVFATDDEGVERRIDRALAIGSDYLDLPVGFLTRIQGGQQEIVVSIGDHPLVQAGETCPLDEAYCRRTVETDSTLAVQHAGSSSAVTERAFETFGFQTYVGAPVTVDGETYGTVCFADEAERAVAFSEREELFLELLAKLVGQSIERRNHERELRERNERLEREKRRFEGIAETSSDIIFRVDLSGEFTYVSAAVDRILGYDPEALVGEPFAAYVTEESVEDALAAHGKVVDGHPVEAVELPFLAADGDTVTLEVNATPIEEDGDLIGVQGVGRDVTAREERERELRLKNRAINDADIGISIADYRESGVPLIYVNDGFEMVTGYPPEEAVGRNCRFLQGEATDSEKTDRLAERIAAGEAATVELVNYRRNDSPFWNRVRLHPVVDDTGAVTHYIGFQTDVTERKRTEQLVRLLNRVLRHNLRNEMNVLFGISDQLRGESPQSNTRLGERLDGTAQRLVSLGDRARELEQYARRDRTPRRLDPADRLDRVVDSARSDFPDATVSLHVETARSVCAGPETERALSELVENALRHNPADEPWVGIEVTDDGEWVEIAVADDGPGIDATESSVISNGAETPLEHGRGLGLWLVNWIVTRYGGSFQIEPRDDGGSVATVRLPAMGPEESVESAAREPTVLFW